MLGFVSYGDLGAIVARGIDRVPSGIELVVGIPRSGMIPAYMIGLYRNVAVVDLPSFLDGKSPENGLRELDRKHSTVKDARWILLVDDSCSSGRAMHEAQSRIRDSGYTGKITTCAIIVEPSRHDEVDIHFREMPHPRLFEWNCFHHTLVEEACFDLDGILCVDPTREENDDGPRYLEFLRNAKPLFRPTKVIGNIVSARLEKYRQPTQQWLSENKILYRNLYLIDLPTAADRIRLNEHCTHKARVYRESGATIFYESDSSQAIEIARLSSKPVLCTNDMHLYLPDMHSWPVKEIVKWQFAVPIGRVKAKVRPILARARNTFIQWVTKAMA